MNEKAMNEKITVTGSGPVFIPGENHVWRQDSQLLRWDIITVAVCYFSWTPSHLLHDLVALAMAPTLG